MELSPPCKNEWKYLACQDRYTEIDRDNRILLKKMFGISAAVTDGIGVEHVTLAPNGTAEISRISLD